MTSPSVIVALSGGVDSAVAALLLRDAGHDVQCLHMTNWEDDDGYCAAAADYQDARRVCSDLDLPLHRVNFTREYRERVFADFLREHAAGRTPNPDVLCNREIKFGVLQSYAKRLGARLLATGHYARLVADGDTAHLLKARDRSKDQSYFLHRVSGRDLVDVLFPLGELRKHEVRALARAAGLSVSDKRDSTGICFIGERPFADFLGRFIAECAGPIRTAEGETIGVHRGLAFYTLGQRQGLGIGGRSGSEQAPWYVAEKQAESNVLVVVQGPDHPRLFQNWLRGSRVHWIGAPPQGRADGAFRCAAKTRYRQPDQACLVTDRGGGEIEVVFDAPQRSITPGQHVVLYDGDRCLGGAVIEEAVMLGARSPSVVQAG